MFKHSGIHKKGELSLSDVIESIKNKPDFHKAGAIGVFIGVVRSETKQGKAVKRLQLEAYEEEADKVLDSICEDLRKKAGIVDVQIHHFVGEFNVTEELVYVLVAGTHRTVVFAALRKAVERYKKEAPVWKKEHLEGGESHWISEPH